MDKNIKTQEVTKVRRASETTTLKSFRNSIVKLKETKMINEEEAKSLEEIAKKLKDRWVALNLDI